MRRDQIRKEAAEALAMLGYSEDLYSWPKRGKLRILVDANAVIQGDAKTDNPMPGAYVEYRLVTRMRVSEIRNILAGIPRRGAPKPVARAVEWMKPDQLTLGNA